MPGLVLHTALAAAALDRWRAAPATAPFDPFDPRVEGAFFRGSVAPDMGYYPGGAPRLSRWAHHAKPADLTRALLARARTDADRAHAWGWATHVMADVALHPLINRASRVILPEGGHGGQLAVHLQIELLLDARLYDRFRTRLGWAAKAPPPGASVDVLLAAFQSIHGDDVTRLEVKRSDRALTRFVPFLFRLSAALSASSRRVPLSAPPAHLLRAALRVLQDFADRVDFQVATGLATLPNHDLDTGAIAVGTVTPAQPRVRERYAGNLQALCAGFPPAPE